MSAEYAAELAYITSVLSQPIEWSNMDDVRRISAALDFEPGKFKDNLPRQLSLFEEAAQ